MIRIAARDERFLCGADAFIHIDVETTDKNKLPEDGRPQAQIWQLAIYVDGPYDSRRLSLLVEHDAPVCEWVRQHTRYDELRRSGTWISKRTAAVLYRACVLSARGDRNVMVGANTAFDHFFSGHLLESVGMAEFYDYHMVCVEEGVKTLCDLPYAIGLEKSAALLGVHRHGAEHDADSDMMLARDVHAELISSQVRLAEARRYAAESGDSRLVELLRVGHAGTLSARSKGFETGGLPSLGWITAAPERASEPERTLVSVG